MNPVGAVALAAALSWFAYKLHWLNLSGAIAASIIGGTVLAAGGSAAAALLAIFFVTSSALTKLAQQHRPYVHEASPSGRVARQVLANGGWAAVGAILIPVSESGWPLLTGALAAAQADTWATEVGAFSRVAPRHVTTWAAVTPGTSGGVTALGTFAGIVGAAVMAIAAFLVGTPVVVAAAAMVSGIAGTVIDSLLGATVQVSFVCERCQVITEQARHGCGRASKQLHGFKWIDNDAVNFMATGFGGALAVGMTSLL